MIYNLAAWTGLFLCCSSGGCAASTGDGQPEGTSGVERRQPLRTLVVEKDESLKLSRELLTLLEEFEVHKAGGAEGEFEPSGAALQVRAGRVAVECSALGEIERLVDDLEALGMIQIASYGGMTSGWLSITALPALAELETLRFARAAMATTH